MYFALRSPPDQPLEGFSSYLARQGCAHRLGRQDRGWEIWVERARDVPVVRRHYQAYAAENGLPPLESDAPGTMLSAQLQTLVRAPFTVALLVASLAVTLWTGFGNQVELLRLFTIVDFELLERQIRYPSLDWLWVSGEWWRLLTPALLHFSVLHLVFNGLWIWLLGTHIEKSAGPVRYLLLVACIGAIANVMQYRAGGPMFGGLSGVVFGLLAYCLLMQRHPRYAGLRLPTGLWVFAGLYIGLGFTPLFQSVGMGKMANAAHLSGLLAGACFGAVHRLLARAGR